MISDPVVRVRRPQVVADEVDGEVIAIDLETGAYFSFRDSASVIWQALLAGDAQVGGIVDELIARYLGPREEVERAVRAFLGRIEAEGLIVGAEIPAGGVPDIDHDRGAVSSRERLPFVVPVFEKYTEMEEFLLIDPIHEVDVTDWPAARTRDPE